jgi:hypothetical protein
MQTKQEVKMKNLGKKREIQDVERDAVERKRREIVDRLC